MVKSNSGSGFIIHAAAARFRVKGSGLLRSRVLNMGTIENSINSLKYKEMDPIAMAPANNREKTILTNFQDQGIQIQFRTTHINETFNISKIILFIKPVAEGYPVKSGG